MNEKSRIKFRRLISMLICLIMILGMPTVTVFADYEDGKECWHCGHYHWDDHCCETCGACTECCNESCYNETHCSGCGVCFTVGELACEKNFLCFACTDNAGLHCMQCNACYCDDPDELCQACKCCAECGNGMCEYCHFCMNCIENDEVGGMHCASCGRCMYGGEVEYSSCSSYYCDECCKYCEGCDTMILSEDGIDFCDTCGFCERCTADEDMVHCHNCGVCLMGGDAQYSQYDMNYCEECCTKCVYCDELFYGVDVYDICEGCGGCPACCANEDANLHCQICGACYYMDADVCKDNLDHCEDCHEICEMCGVCMTDNPDAEACEFCGLCTECCLEMSEAAGCVDGTCIADPDFEFLFCLGCHESFEDVEQCEYCGLCIDCCAEQSECVNGMCVESDEYESHFCEICGECFCNVDQCETCDDPICVECCRELAEEAGCDGSCGEDWGFCSENFALHLEQSHGKDMTDHDAYPENKWSYDSEKHWHGCYICDDKDHYTDVGKHTFNNEGVCSKCGYKKETEIDILRQPSDCHCRVTDPNHGGEKDELSVYNNKATFTVKARGKSELTYQWQQYYNNEWRNLNENEEELGVYSDTFTTVIPEDACDEPYTYIYRCLISDQEGHSVTTNEVCIKAKHVYHVDYHDAQGNAKVYERIMNIERPGVTPRYVNVGGEGIWITSSLGHNYACICHHSEDVFENKTPLAHNFDDWTVLDGTDEKGLKYAYRTCEDCGYIEYKEYRGILINKQPESVVCNTSDHYISGYHDPLSEVNNKVTFSVAADGLSELSYQWMESYDGGQNWTALKDKKDTWAGHPDYNLVEGANTDTLTISVPTTACEDRTYYRCVITDEDENIVVSDSAKLIASHVFEVECDDGHGGTEIRVRAENVERKAKGTYKINKWDNGKLVDTIFYQTTEGHKIYCVGDGCSKVKSNKPFPHNYGDWESENGLWEVFLPDGTVLPHYDGLLEFRTCKDCGYTEYKINGISIISQPQDVNTYTSHTFTGEYNIQDNFEEFTVVADGNTELTYSWERYVVSDTLDGTWEKLEDDQLGRTIGYKVSGVQTSTLKVQVPYSACCQDLRYRCVITDKDGNKVITDEAHLYAKHLYDLQSTDENNQPIIKHKYENVIDKSYKNGEVFTLQLDTGEFVQKSTRGGHAYRCYGCDRIKGIGEPEPHTFSDWITLGMDEDGQCYLVRHCTLCGYEESMLIDGFPVTFDRNGGSGSMPTISVDFEHGEKLLLPNCEFTAPKGKEFYCWYVENAVSTTKTYAPGEQVEVTANKETELHIVVKALWQDSTNLPTTATVSFSAGTNGTGTKEPVTVDIDTAYELPDASDFTAVGPYTFFCWSVGGFQKNPGDEVVISTDTVVTALWRLNRYTVSFDTVGGTQVSSQTVEHGGKVKQPSKPYKAGFTFDGWYTDSGYQEEFDFDSAIEGETTIVAKWKKNADGTFTVALPAGEGFKAEAVNGSASPVKEGKSFSFKVTIEEGYEKDGFAVTLKNGQGNGENNILVYDDSTDTYTIRRVNTDLEVAVNGVSAMKYAVSVTNGKALSLDSAEELKNGKCLSGMGVQLVADYPASGMAFDKWIVKSGNITLSDVNDPNAKFTMVSEAVSVEATYKALPPKPDHVLVLVPGKDATCEVGGHDAYYMCTDCDKWFKDAYGTEEITDKNSVITPAKGHTASEWITDVPAGTTTTGTKHTECLECKKVLDHGTIPATGKPEPKMKDGDGQVVYYGERKELVFRSDAEFKDFIRVEIDDKVLDLASYTKAEGSTIITLLGDYVCTIPVGLHTISIVSQNGIAKARFAVLTPPNGSPNGDPNGGANGGTNGMNIPQGPTSPIDPDKDPGTMPKTGERNKTNPLIFVMIAILCVDGVVAIVYKRKRKKIKSED